MLRETCGAGTDHFDSERYLREREAFGSMIMGWRSAHTIDVYDHSRGGEQTLHVLALMQQRLAEQRSLPAEATQPPLVEEKAQTVANQPVFSEETLWFHDEETLAWIKKMQKPRQC